MSRPIKFRVYDQTSKDYTVYGIGEVVDEHFGLGIISRIVWWLKGIKHKFIIEQYTGLKDKNGKEIYEGDIVNYKLYADSRLDYIDEVFYSTISGAFMVGEEDNIRSLDCLINVEVIGNIHENKELLGGK